MDRRDATPFANLLADYFTTLAQWRRQRYDDDLRDKRNLVSAEGILAMSKFVQSLPKDDERIVQLDRMWRHGDHVEVGQQAAYEIGRFRFFNPAAELDAFLDDIVQLALADNVERAHFGFKQPPGDDPWN